MADATVDTGTAKEKGRAFTGVWAGAGYLVLTKLFGFTRAFYQRALGDIDVSGDLAVLDLGCGPGVLSFALAKKMTAKSSVHGIDLSADQIRYARENAAGYPPAMHFSVASMDELPFPEAAFDVVMTSMALHEAAIPARRGAIREVSRVLKPGGKFLLVDWSRPRFGLLAAIWLPFLLFGKNNRDNWTNAYAAYCGEEKMRCVEDRYINSIVRRQVFEKEPAAPKNG